MFMYAGAAHCHPSKMSSLSEAANNDGPVTKALPSTGTHIL